VKNKQNSVLPTFALVVLLAVSCLGANAPAAPTNAMHKHANRAQCVDCHGTEPKRTVVEAKACLQCHGSYEELAKKTAHLENMAKFSPNPHAAHTGNLRCTLCHHEHKSSEVYCNTCHNPGINMKVP